MLWVSDPEDLFDLLQQLLSPSTVESWYQKHLLRSIQRETRIKLWTNNFKILEQVDVMMVVQGINVDRLLGIVEVSELELLRSCPDPFLRLPELLKI